MVSQDLRSVKDLTLKKLKGEKIHGGKYISKEPATRKRLNICKAY